VGQRKHTGPPKKKGKDPPKKGPFRGWGEKNPLGRKKKGDPGGKKEGPWD